MSRQVNTAVVTGSANRLGKLIARRLLQLGYRVVIHGRNEVEAYATAEELGTIHHVSGDLHSQSTKEYITRYVEQHFEDGLGLLVHNASTFCIDPDRHAAHFTRTVFINAMESASWVYGLNMHLERSLRQADGSCIALTDYATVNHWDGFIAHGAAKSAIEAIQRHLSRLEMEKDPGHGRIRYASLRLPTVLPPDEYEDLARLERLYGPIYDTDMAVNLVVDFSTEALNDFGNYELKGMSSPMNGGIKDTLFVNGPLGEL